jgi:hypothetical protein
MGRPDLDIGYFPGDSLNKNLDHPLNRICKLRDGNFPMRHLAS